ncbi:Hypothetical predicted protein [Cloeon dipterum]|uniref:Uncharacterized protein n=1 Tax=Cloeon dipterum TaxID=197152 RepID=A0A8S1E801_9INSE|nr:Hypothetical predicted protein [Cloeon dipterum]
MESITAGSPVKYSLKRPRSESSSVEHDSDLSKKKYNWRVMDYGNKATALHYVATNLEYGEPVAEFLIRMGMRCDAEDFDGLTPLDYALRAKNLGVAKILFKRLNQSDRNLCSLLNYCVKKNQIDWAKTVLECDESAAITGETLMIAFRYADWPMCEWLFKLYKDNADVKTVKDLEGKILHLAAANSNAATIIPKLVDYRSNVNKYVCGKTPLTIALGCQNIGAAEALVKLGADLEQKIEGYNLLQICTINNLFKSMKYLYEKDATQAKEVADNNGETILMTAAMFGSTGMCRWLCYNGEDWRAVNDLHLTTLAHYAAFNTTSGVDIMTFIHETLKNSVFHSRIMAVEVVAENWPAMLGRMENALQDAIFVAIDNEFSGLNDTGLEDISFEQRYLKLRGHIREFCVVQVGVSIFRKDAESGGYTSQVFSIYLFPSTNGGNDVQIRFQASSIEFLTRYNFDFNKMMHHGVNFVSLEQAEKLKQAIRKQHPYVQQQKQLLSVDLLESYRRVCSDVMAWAADAKDREETIFQIPDGLCPYLLQWDVRAGIPDIWARLHGNSLVVSKVGEKMRKELEDAHRAKEEAEAFDKLIGFTKFFSLLIEQKIPLVGHNVMLDMMHMFQQLIEPLPESYWTYKQKLLKHFPVIFDTKLMSLEIKQKIDINDVWNSDLQRLYNYLHDSRCANFAPGSPEVSIQEPEPGSGDGACILQAHFHDAGWDSFCTGYVFIKLAHISAVFDEAVKSEDKIAQFDLSWDDLMSAVQPLRNKVHIVMAKTNYIVLDGPDPDANWNNIVFLQAKGKEDLRFENLEQLFLQFGSVDIKMVDSKRALLANPTPECLKEVLKFCKTQQSWLRASRFSPLKHTDAGRSAMWAAAFASLAGGSLLVISAFC